MKIHAYTMLCASIVSQKAAIEALKSGEPVLQDMLEQYNQRRRLIVEGLNSLGLPCHMPQGAFMLSQYRIHRAHRRAVCRETAL